MPDNHWNNGKNIAMLLAGICAGTLAMWGAASLRDRSSFQENVPGSPNSLSSITGEGNTGGQGGKVQDISDIIELQQVDYPFGHGKEEWRLMLYRTVSESGAEHTDSGYLFRLYDGSGEPVQEFPCEIEAEELLFRFDRLYGYGNDLEVFSADAEETGTTGLLFAWDYETKCFQEEPIVIPWYEKGDNILYDTAYLVRNTWNNVEEESICRINPKTRQPVELRRWTLTEPVDGEGPGYLEIWNCLKQVALYEGEVEWNEIGEPVNGKYYQGIYWRDLEDFWDHEQEQEITVLVVTWDGEKENFENRVYESTEAFLADFGFGNAEPFYEYGDANQEPVLELYFDEETGQGCGLYYNYGYNYELEEIVESYGFVFQHVETKEWIPEETFSTLSVFGEDAGTRQTLGYSETYKYTDDGKLSSFEARGTVPDINTELSLLSMDYYYRGDGTLSYKAYHHNTRAFYTSRSSEKSWYDELERLVYRHSYITHGSLEYFYIYEDDGERPAYILVLDMYSDAAWPNMYVCR